MKKLIAVILSLALCCLLIPAVAEEASVTGTWYILDASRDGVDIQVVDPEGITVVFNEDGTCTMAMGAMSGTAAWTVADSVITITGDEEEEKTEFKIDGDNLIFDNAGTTVRLTKTPAEKPAGPAALAPETVDAFDGTWLPKAQLAYGLYGELTEDEKAMVATLKIEAGKVTAVPSFGDPESYDAAFADGKLAFEGESYFVPFKAVITLLDDGTLLYETTMDMGGAEMTVGYLFVNEAAAEEPAA